jgi:hypothetical protein
MLNESYIEDKAILRINPHALGGAGGESRKIKRARTVKDSISGGLWLTITPRRARERGNVYHYLPMRYAADANESWPAPPD